MKKLFFGTFWVAIFIGMSAAFGLQADAYDSWVKRESGTTRHLFASAVNENVIIIVGEQGTILTSSDGLAWRTQSLTSNTFYAVNLLVYRHPDQAWDPVSQSWKQKTNFMAVGQSGQFATSDDGVQWQVGHFGIDLPFYGITSAGYIAAVAPRRILFSASGLTWSQEFSSRLLYGMGIDTAQPSVVRLAVVGVNGLIWTKNGGEAWRDMLAPTVKTLTSIASDNAFIVVVGDDGALLRGVHSSWRGEIQWTSGPVFPEVHFKHVTVAGGYYFAVGSDRSTADDFKFGRGVPGKGVLMTSPDGLRWTKREVGNAPGLYSIQPFKGSVFAFGENGTILQNSTNTGPVASLDAWAPRPGNTTNALSSVAFGNGTFVAVGGSGTILTSPDGVEWERRNAPATGNIPRVRFLDGNFVALGAPFLVSADGINWRQAVREGSSDPFGGEFLDVTHGPEGFLAVAKESATTSFTLFAKSTDGQSWRSEVAPERIFGVWGGVAYGNGIYLAAGNGLLPITTVLTSVDSGTWSKQSLDFRAFPRFGPGYFVMFGMLGDHRVAITTDGRSFESQSVTFSNNGDATFDASTWVAVGPGGAIFSSFNGRDWDPRPSGTTLDLNGVAYGAGTFVAVGANGLILQSGRVTQQRPLLSQARVNGQNQFAFVLGGESGREYVVQRSEDLVHWVDCMFGSPGESLAISPSNSIAFYRALPRSQ